MKPLHVSSARASASRATRPALVALVAVLALACGLGRGPALEIVLSGTDGTGEHDADVIVGRLRAMGVDAEAVGRAPDAIVLHVSGVPEGFTARDVLAPGALRFHLVDERQRTCDWDDDACILAQLEQPPLLTNADVAGARVGYERDQPPHVEVEFTPAGRDRFGAATSAAVGRKLAIVLDDELVSAPVIREAITGGRAWIDMGSAQNDPKREAEALAASLRAGDVLQGSWTVASENVVEP